MTLAAAPRSRKTSARKTAPRKLSARKNKEKLDRRYTIDLLIRALLGLTFAFSAGVCLKNGFQMLQVIDFDHLNVRAFGKACSVLAMGLYTLMVACIYVVRLRPQNKFAGAWPCAAAILGGYLMSALILFQPRDDLPFVAQLFACLLVLIGNAFAVLVLLRLGKSFSILPESRKLVTNGPYKIVRHPLYLAEAVATLGAVINFLSPWTLALVAAQIALQLVRMHYEERVLRETFPEYTEYAKRTARLIPGIY